MPERTTPAPPQRPTPRPAHRPDQPPVPAGTASGGPTDADVEGLALRILWQDLDSLRDRLSATTAELPEEVLARTFVARHLSRLASLVAGQRPAAPADVGRRPDHPFGTAVAQPPGPAVSPGSTAGRAPASLSYRLVDLGVRALRLMRRVVADAVDGLLDRLDGPEPQAPVPSVPGWGQTPMWPDPPPRRGPRPGPPPAPGHSLADGMFDSRIANRLQQMINAEPALETLWRNGGLHAVSARYLQPPEIGGGPAEPATFPIHTGPPASPSIAASTSLFAGSDHSRSVSPLPPDSPGTTPPGTVSLQRPKPRRR